MPGTEISAVTGVTWARSGRNIHEVEAKVHSRGAAGAGGSLPASARASMESAGGGGTAHANAMHSANKLITVSEVELDVPGLSYTVSPRARSAIVAAVTAPDFEQSAGGSTVPPLRGAVGAGAAVGTAAAAGPVPRRILPAGPGRGHPRSSLTAIDSAAAAGRPALARAPSMSSPGG